MRTCVVCRHNLGLLGLTEATIEATKMPDDQLARLNKWIRTMAQVFALEKTTAICVKCMKAWKARDEKA